MTQLVDYQLVASLKAEREGFEPPVPLGTTVFKTVVIDHSTISPMVMFVPALLLSECKGRHFLLEGQIFFDIFYQ